MDILLSTVYKDDAPGASVLVVKNGNIILKKAYGLANLELNIPLTTEMVFRIGSISKQFTAAAIMKLVESNKINLSDPITKYLPDYPVQGYNITIENLLTHTSGIKNYTQLPETMKKIGMQDLNSVQLIENFKNEDMDFAPSEAFLYSNSGYVLLGRIIEIITDKSYAEYIQEEIFTPLEMSNSYYGSFTKIIPNRVMGYSATGEGIRNAEYLSMRIPFAAGALLSTVDDLQKWNDALFSGKVISKKLFSKMTTPFSLLNSENKSSQITSQGYGYGLNMTALKGHKIVGHSGGINGFRSRMHRIMEDDLLVIVLANQSNAVIDPDSVAYQLSAIAIGEPFVQPQEVQIDPVVLKKYVGVYSIENVGIAVTISFADGQLYLQVMDGNKTQITAYSITDFYIKGSLSRYTFLLDKNDKAMKLRLYQAEGVKGLDEMAIRQ